MVHQRLLLILLLPSTLPMRFVGTAEFASSRESTNVSFCLLNASPRVQAEVSPCAELPMPIKQHPEDALGAAVAARGDIALCPGDVILMGHPPVRGGAGAAPFRPLFFLWLKQSPRHQGCRLHDRGQEGRDCSWWCGRRHFVPVLCSARDCRRSIRDEHLSCHVMSLVICGSRWRLDSLAAGPRWRRSAAGGRGAVLILILILIPIRSMPGVMSGGGQPHGSRWCGGRPGDELLLACLVR